MVLVKCLDGEGRLIGGSFTGRLENINNPGSWDDEWVWPVNRLCLHRCPTPLHCYRQEMLGVGSVKYDQRPPHNRILLSALPCSNLAHIFSLRQSLLASMLAHSILIIHAKSLTHHKVASAHRRAGFVASDNASLLEPHNQPPERAHVSDRTIPAAATLSESDVNALVHWGTLAPNHCTNVA